MDYIFPSDNSFDIPTLLLEKQAGSLLLPFAAYGSGRRFNDAQTVHFYIDDYRFDNVWKCPAKVFSQNIIAATEPNFSLFDTTPVAYGLQQIYKKRSIARYWQECGILIYADLNVSSKFYDYNRLGIPQGYNAFFTRGYADRLCYVKAELEIARELSDLQTPNLIVYGGGKKINQFCMDNNILYIHDFMTSKNIRANG
jgi:hypothetical protein